MIAGVVGKKVNDVISTEDSDQCEQHSGKSQIEPAHGINYSPEKAVVYRRAIH